MRRSLRTRLSLHTRLWPLSLGASLWLNSVDSVAQDVGGEAPPAAPAAPSEPASDGQTTGRVVLPPNINTTRTVINPGLPAPGTNLEGHLGSSSQALSDISQGDRFDLNSKQGPGVATLRGNPDAPGLLADEVRGGTGVYLVKRGDTLSSISQGLYGHPAMWPKLWSLNPQIQNPHWIYPGDQIRLEGFATAPAARQVRTLGSGFQSSSKTVPPSTVFLRQMGYIDDPRQGILGEVVGAKAPVQLLAEGDTAYVVMREGQKAAKGDRLTVFRSIRRVPKIDGARRPPGSIIAIQGTIKVQDFDPKTRVVRGEIVESLDVIERGAKVGHIARDFVVIPPKRANRNVSARVLTSLYPHVLVGQNQVVFIDRGHHDGLERGNRLFVIRRGDTWRRTLDTAADDARARIKLQVEQPLQVEMAPLHGDEQQFPEEVVGELRVVETQKFSAFAVVTESATEIVPGDRAVVRSGF